MSKISRFHGFFHRFFRSIFTKLIFISLLTWVLILITVVAAFFISKQREGKSFYNNFNLYIEYIVEDLGSSPDRAKAMAISERTGLHIAYIGENENWSTRDGFPDVNGIDFHPVCDNLKYTLGKRIGHHIMRVETENGLLFFYFVRMDDDSRHGAIHLFLIVIISVILLACYFTLKKILQPLRWLGAGVEQVAHGNLDHKVPVRGRDELTELSEGFNEMVGRLKKMLTTKEHLLRDISHELRSPLTRMKVALELINDDDLKSEVEQDIVEMEHMINGILESARDHHQSKEQEKVLCNIGEIVLSVTTKYTKSTPTVRFTSPTSVVRSRVDENSLRILCTNLIENALKFSTETSVPVLVTLSCKDKVFTLSVTDSGSGISEKELPYIFEPFYRVDKSRSRKTGGYGLGLSLCKAIVEAHGGRISATSTVNMGTTIQLIFPLEK